MEFGYKNAWQAAAADYGPMTGIHPALRKRGLIDPVVNLDGALVVVGALHMAANRMADISDGSSYTILIAEDAGRPQLWRTDGAVAGKTTSGAGWADRDNALELS